MARIVRLTESDLTRLVKRIINEQPEDGVNYNVRGQIGYHSIQESSKQEVDRFLENLPENTKFLNIKDCEYADFSNIDMCAFPELIFVNLRGTENNFDRQDYDCPYDQYGDGLYDFNSSNFED
jgi:hypothetical protein